MKILNSIGIALALIASINIAQAEEHKDHKVIAGPKGGKIVEIDSLHAEFFVNAERKVEVTFYDEKMKPVPTGDQVVSVIAEAKDSKTKLDFEKKGDSFISKSTLPEGDGYTVVLQIKPTPDAKMKNFRIVYHTETCGKCKRAEYACACEDQGGGAHEGHGH